jgi:uncharacterized RmlC-like cupin family protein
MPEGDGLTDHSKKLLLEPYLDWTAGEGLPVHEGFGVDMLAAETGRWDRMDAKGAFIHVKGRGDFVSTYALDIPPGKTTAPQKHMFENVVYVLEGHGSTTVELGDGRKHTFEWGPKSMFALPLNVRYRHYNGSGRERALLACTHDLPLVMNLFHNHDFVFDNPFDFADRAGAAKHFEGEGDFIAVAPGRDMWETNYVPDLTTFQLKAWEARGSGSSTLSFILAEGTMHAHTSEIPAAKYKKAHRHGNGIHIYAVTGTGYSLFWYEGEQEFVNIPWRHGVMYAPPDWMFHQHFNTAPEPARYLAIGIGSRRYPFLGSRRKGIEGGMDTSVKEGGRQIEFADQDPRVHAMWLQEVKATGVASAMGKDIDETIFAGHL